MQSFGLVFALSAVVSLTSSHVIDELISSPKWGFADIPTSTKTELATLIEKKHSGCRLAVCPLIP